MWKAWKRTVDFPTLPTRERRRTVESVEKDRRLFHPSHSKRRGTALRAIIIIGKERMTEETYATR